MIRTVRIPQGRDAAREVPRMGATDCTSTFWDIVDPTCWFSDPLGVDPSLAINLPTCTSGTADQQAACRNAAAQIQVASDANIASVSPSGLASGVVSDIVDDWTPTIPGLPTWALWAAGIGAVVVVLGVVRR